MKILQQIKTMTSSIYLWYPYPEVHCPVMLPLGSDIAACTSTWSSSKMVKHAHGSGSPNRTMCPATLRNCPGMAQTNVTKSSRPWPGYHIVQLLKQWSIDSTSGPWRSHLAAYRTQRIFHQCLGARNHRTTLEVLCLCLDRSEPGEVDEWACMDQTWSFGLGSGSLGSSLGSSTTAIAIREC